MNINEELYSILRKQNKIIDTYTDCNGKSIKCKDLKFRVEVGCNNNNQTWITYCLKNDKETFQAPTKYFCSLTEKEVIKIAEKLMNTLESRE